MEITDVLWKWFHDTLAGLLMKSSWAKSVEKPNQALLWHDSLAIRRIPTLHLDGWIIFVVCVAVKKIWAVAPALSNQDMARWNSSTWWEMIHKTAGWRESIFSSEPWCSSAIAGGCRAAGKHAEAMSPLTSTDAWKKQICPAKILEPRSQSPCFQCFRDFTLDQKYSPNGM